MKQTNKQVLIYYNFCNNEIERKMIHIHFDGATLLRSYCKIVRSVILGGVLSLLLLQ